MAELSGTVKAPRLAVSTNLDQAVSARLQEVIGEELARAQRQVRAEVDRIVAAKAHEVRAQVAAVEAEGSERIEAERRRLDAVEGELRGQLRKLTAGIQIPGLRLP